MTAHRIFIGDCRRPEDVSKLLGGKKINLAMTSPPYASQRVYDEQSEFKPIHPDKYVEWFKAVSDNVRDHLAPDGSWFVNIKEHAEDGQRHLYVKDLVIAHVRQWGWRFVDEFCWKRSGLPGTWPDRFKNSWEPVFHFARQQEIKFRPAAVQHKTDSARVYSPELHFGFGDGGYEQRGKAQFVDGNALPSNVVEVASGSAGGLTGDHPAAFPVALPEFFIRAYTDPGDLVYDPFAGSGTTIVAAERTGRIGCGMELSPKYAAVALQRLSDLGLKPRLETSKPTRAKKR